MAASPRVSVVMTTYNGGRFVRETIDSILTQSFTDFEFLIIDDNSTDNTIDIIKSYDDPRMQLFRNPENIGISRTRNRGIDLAGGEYLAATDHDDISLPKRLERQVEFLDTNPDVVLAGTAAWFMENNTITHSCDAVTDPYVMHWGLLTQSRLVPSSTCMRLNILRHHKIYYRPEYDYADDYDLFHRLAQVGKVVSIPDCLSIYRIHENNNTKLHRTEMKVNSERILFEVYRDFLGLELSHLDIDCIWRIFSSIEAARDDTELLKAGTLLQTALKAFLKRMQLEAEHAKAVQDFASTDWWHAVSRTARALGQRGILKCYRAIPELSTTVPSFAETCATLAVASLGPRLMNPLRHMQTLFKRPS